MKNAWENWKVFAVKAGDVQAKIVFSLLYLLVMIPTGAIVSLFVDLFNSRKFPQWHDIVDNTSSVQKLRQQ